MLKISNLLKKQQRNFKITKIKNNYSPPENYYKKDLSTEEKEIKNKTFTYLMVGGKLLFL